jgi:hypothetical protein
MKVTEFHAARLREAASRGAGFPDVPAGTPFAVFVDETMALDGGFVPSVAYRDVAGFFPLSGGTFARPWVWGPSIEQARAECVKYNREMGVDEQMAGEIRLSSMRASTA